VRELRWVWNNLPVNAHVVTAHDWYLLACVAGTVLLLLLLVVKFKLHAALGLAVAAMGLGIAAGMPLKQVPLSFTAGVGNMMGHIAIILGMGAILGQLLASSGGAAALGRVLVEGCGPKAMPWALLGLALLVGMPVFFEVGLVLLFPIVVEAARRSGRPPILVGLPVLAGLSITHGLIPPHPSALLAAAVFHADIGRVILWGMVVGALAAALAGPVVGWVLIPRWERRQAKLANEGIHGGPTHHDETVMNGAPATLVSLVPKSEAPGAPGGGYVDPTHHDETVMNGAPAGVAPAGAVLALAAILLPIALIFVGSWADSFTTPGGIANQVMHMLGYPDVAMLLAVLVALWTLGTRIPREPHHGPDMLRRLTADSFVPIAGVLVILSAAGGLSGVLRDSGAAQATVGLALGAHMPPLVLAWALAAVVRVCMGSSTVAMAVASGVLAPVAGQMGVRPEMLVLATGCGSLLLSHVNDSGFWLVGTLFKMDVKGTLATWSVVETVLSISGLGITLLLAAVL
jgi:GntP family gluconate:H+ symporter